MARKAAAAKTTTINRATPAPAVDIERYCRGLNNWPRSWMGLEDDLPPGEQLVACFRPSLEHLATSEKSKKIIQEHVDNMWALDGEFISELNYDPTLRNRPVDRLLLHLIRHGGPHLRHADQDQQASFDSTCRRFRQFLIRESRADARRRPQIPPTRQKKLHVHTCSDAVAKSPAKRPLRLT